MQTKTRYWLILIFVAILSGLYIVQIINNSDSFDIDLNNKSSTSTLISEPDLKTWKAYTNLIYGVEFKYPPTLKFKSDNPGYVNFELVSPNPSVKHLQGLTVYFYNNPKEAVIAEWIKKDFPEEKCVQKPRLYQTNDNTFIDVSNDQAICSQSTRRNIYAGKNNRIAVFSTIEPLSDLTDIASTVTFTNSINTINQDGPIFYAANDRLFYVKKKTFILEDYFSPLELSKYSMECTTNKSESYYKKLLNKISAVDYGTKYFFYFIGDTQDSGLYEVTVIPNKFGYKNEADFEADFGYCAAGGSQYPDIMNESYLLFDSSCSTGFDDGSGKTHGSCEVKDFVEDSLKLK